MGAIKMFGLEYTRVQVLIQLVGKQRYVNVPHKKNRPGVTIQQLKLMAKRSRGRGGAGGGGGRWKQLRGLQVRLLPGAEQGECSPGPE